jgi:hypothetical protein
LCAAITLGIIVLVRIRAIFFTDPPIGVAPNAVFPARRSVMAASIAADVMAVSSAVAVGSLEGAVAFARNLTSFAADSPETCG